MTVKELKEALNRCHDDMEVSVRIETPGGLVCPDGAVCDVFRACRGIDWHGHELLIIPKYKLKLVDEEEVEKWRYRK